MKFKETSLKRRGERLGPSEPRLMSNVCCRISARAIDKNTFVLRQTSATVFSYISRNLTKLLIDRGVFKNVQTSSRKHLPPFCGPDETGDHQRTYVSVNRTALLPWRRPPKIDGEGVWWSCIRSSCMGGSPDCSRGFRVACKLPSVPMVA